uniref:Putative long neurotoxin n=1 Tax=Austrelaps labialis TaxID=471292 RepID=B2BRQ7_AUSLA|nr:putative long neurotoxin [Austrelaps labialis]
MKTLLLTLVVVTIVCLDLAGGLICYLGRNTPGTCPPGQELCYIVWCGAFCHDRRVKLGCAATCPIPKRYEKVTCCSTDNCNQFPTQKSR